MSQPWERRTTSGDVTELFDRVKRLEANATLLGGDKAVYQDSNNVAPRSFQPMGWFLASGNDFLDISVDPTAPVMRESGIYVVAFSGHGPHVEPSVSVGARYYRAIAAFSLPKNTIETADLTNHGLIETNDTNGADLVFPAADYTGENYSFAAASPSEITILTPGIYSIRYLVGVNPTYFVASAYELNLIIDGIDSNDSKVVYLDETFNSIYSGDNAVYDRVFNVLAGSLPLTLQFRAEQRSANNWVYTGGGTQADMGGTQIDLIKWEGDLGSAVGTVALDMDTAGDDVHAEQTFPLQAEWMDLDATFRRSWGTITVPYYIPAGSGVDAFIGHSSDATLNFDYQAIVQRIAAG